MQAKKQSIEDKYVQCEIFPRNLKEECDKKLAESAKEIQDKERQLANTEKDLSEKLSAKDASIKEKDSKIMKL